MSDKDPRRPLFDRLSGIRKRAINRFGVSAVHSAEDGATFGFILGLLPTFPTGALIILAAFGVESRNPKRLIHLADKIGREEDIRRQPVCFIAFLAISAISGAGLGTLLQRIYTEYKIAQTITDLLMVV